MGIFYITKSVIMWLDITKTATYNQVAVTKLVKKRVENTLSKLFLDKLN